MTGRQIRASEGLSNAALLQRLSVIEDILGIGEVIEPGAATITPSSATNWSMAPGTAITFYDTAGISRVILGALPSGDYGLQVTDPTDVANEIWPVSSGFALGSNTSSNTPVSLGADSPTVDAFIGASGDAIVTCTASIYAASSPLVANVNLAIDGTSPTGHDHSGACVPLPGWGSAAAHPYACPIGGPR